MKNSEAHAEGYPGRKVPPTCTVEDVKEEKGVAIECTRHQTGMNRYPINTEEEKRKTHGPNN